MIRQLTLTIFFICSTLFLLAQYNSPVEYMAALGEKHEEITKDSWSYVKVVARGKSARKVERRREDLAETILEARNGAKSMKPFEGDASLRDAVTEYLRIYYIVINEDYAKIVDMEEVAEQSYDMMEAYILAKKKAGDKLEKAGEQLNEVEEAFAETHNVNLIEGEKSKRQKKISEAADVLDYYNKVYLIFFKSYKQEAYLINAFNNKDVNALEQNKQALKVSSEEGKEKIAKVPSYEGDSELKNKVRNLLSFYVAESNTDTEVMTTFLLEEEKFNRIKSHVEGMKQSKRTQEDIDRYNKAADSYNKASEKLNAVFAKTNKNREHLLEDWNKSSEDFFKKYAP